MGPIIGDGGATICIVAQPAIFSVAYLIHPIQRFISLHFYTCIHLLC